MDNSNISIPGKEDFDRACEWYKEHKQELLPQYKGKHIAITGNPPEIIDSDVSEREINLRQGNQKIMRGI